MTWPYSKKLPVLRVAPSSGAENFPSPRKSCVSGGDYTARKTQGLAEQSPENEGGNLQNEDQGEGMRFFFDTEFIDDGKTIDLISIGIKAEDGREYYAESYEFNRSCANEWFINNVLPHLREVPKPRAVIAAEIIGFVGQGPEFWGYYSSYDWVALCQLYGPMIARPSEWPMYCMDLKQFCLSLGNPRLPPQEGKDKHDAMCDARWNFESFKFLANFEGQLNARWKEA